MLLMTLRHAHHNVNQQYIADNGIPTAKYTCMNGEYKSPDRLIYTFENAEPNST